MSDNWQPIETAPEDGSSVIVSSNCRVGESSYGICQPQSDGYRANNGRPCWRTACKVFVYPGHITHWQPLPKQPATSSPPVTQHTGQ